MRRFFQQPDRAFLQDVTLSFCRVSAIFSNMGLTEIIHFSLPTLTSIYPPFIVLVLAGALFAG